MQQFAVAGWPVAGRSESQLDVIIRRARQSFRRLIDILTQPGRP